MLGMVEIQVRPSSVLDWSNSRYDARSGIVRQSNHKGTVGVMEHKATVTFDYRTIQALFANNYSGALFIRGFYKVNQSDGYRCQSRTDLWEILWVKVNVRLQGHNDIFLLGVELQPSSETIRSLIAMPKWGNFIFISCVSLTSEILKKIFVAIDDKYGDEKVNDILWESLQAGNPLHSWASSPLMPARSDIELLYF